jgi:hypothetical protein
MMLAYVDAFIIIIIVIVVVVIIGVVHTCIVASTVISSTMSLTGVMLSSQLVRGSQQRWLRWKDLPGMATAAAYCYDTVAHHHHPERMVCQRTCLRQPQLQL